MKINIRYFGIMDYELPSEITLKEGSTVKHAVEINSLDYQDIHSFTFMLNKEPADINDILEDGDTLLIFQVLGGG